VYGLKLPGNYFLEGLLEILFSNYSTCYRQLALILLDLRKEISDDAL
jgi:hypothetical protein